MDPRIAASRARSARGLADAMMWREGETNRLRGGLYDAMVGAVPPQTARSLASLLDFVPGLGDAAGFEDAYQAGKAGDYGTAALLGAAGLVGLAPGVGDAAAKGMRKGIRAYHGSPHDFDRFDISKIGTGEGAQAYGHGLYFAENEGVARSYRDALTDKTVRIDGAPASALSGAERRMAESIDAAMSNGASLSDALSSARQRMMSLPDGTPGKTEHLTALDEIERRGASQASGRMYEVNINADPDEFLDWDLPLAGQSRAIQNVIRSANPTAPGMARGSELYEAIAKTRTPRETGKVRLGASDTSELLREAGIPGIRYLDAGSRGAGDGSRNYVVFDDSLVEIIRKYGLAGLMAMGGLGALYQQPEPEQY